MILIADSGSTKTTWSLIEAGEVKSTVQSAGLNPYFHTSSSVDAILCAELIPYTVTDNVRDIHFYGAGCSTEKNDTLIREALAAHFRKAQVFIHHDILGAARALFGRGAGISCILGTGCNCCYYDGTDIHSKVDSLGYLFGDEGAGSYLGKNFLSAFLRKQLPADLEKDFRMTYHFTLEDILNSLYNLPYPNRFLASFSMFMAPRKDHPYIHDLVKRSFHDFFEAQVKHYDQYDRLPVSFVGSIAFYYREILEEAAREDGIQIGTIIRAPMTGLIRYHAG